LTLHALHANCYRIEPRLREGRALCRRCSRPLCSSQDTDGTMYREPPSGGPRRQAVRGKPQEAAASSGPNSVLTQTDVPCARSAVPQAGCLLAALSRADLSE